MHSRTRLVFFSVLTLFTLILSLTNPLVAYADDPTPAPSDGGETVSPPSQPDGSGSQDASQPATADDPAAPTADASQAAPADDAAAPAADGAQDTTAAPQTDASQPAPTSDSAPADTQDTSAAPADSGSQPADPQAQDVSDILQQVPDSTDVVVVNPDGTAEPLASQAAATAILTGDPMWCPTGALPGDPTCTGSFSTFTGAGGLLTALAGGSYSGNGVIYVQNTYNSSLETGNVVIDGNVLTSLTDLTIQGGWDGVLGGTNIVGTSTFSVPLAVLNWLGNVSVNDVVATGANPLASLTVANAGDITVDNVTATGNTTGSGAYLYNATGTGNVSVTNSTFSTNHDTGVAVVSSGNVALDNVTAQGNLFYGADINNSSGAGTVSVTNGSNFSSNTNSGIGVFSTGAVTLNDVTVNGNGTYGANLDTSYGTGDITIGGTASVFTNNGYDGIFAQSGGAFSLDNVTSSNNFFDGAYLDASFGSGDITITNSTFDNNDRTGGGDLYGLDAYTYDGDISLDNVTVTNSAVDGAYLDSYSGNISVTNGSDFSSNGGAGLVTMSEGDVTVDNITADNNGSYGAYLDSSYGTGNITVTNSSFTGNGEVGLKAATGQGNILVDNVMVDGSGVSSLGAWLKTYDGGDLVVQNSSFQNNSDAGLVAVSSGTATLTNVTASNNGGNGAEVYSTWAYACFGPKGIPVTVDGGTFQNNGGYGLFVAPGPLGTLTFLAPPTYGGNALGDYLLDLTDNCKECDNGGDEEEPGEGKPVNIVELPETGGTPVEQDCEQYSGTELHLPNGTTVLVGCPFTGQSVAEQVDQDHLPDHIPAGPTFISAVSVGLTANGQPVEGLEDDATLTVSFDIPEGMESKHFSVLYWDPTANNGQGAWIELPQARNRHAEMPLHANNPDDLRKILDGVHQEDGRVSVTVNFPGIFALVGR